MLAISKTRRRFLALAILFIAVLLFFMLIVQPYVYALTASEEYVDSVKFEHFNNQKLLNKKDYYIEGLGFMEETYDGQSIYLNSDRRTLANAELQEIFKNIAERSNTDLISTQVITDEVNVETGVGLSARLRADIFALQELIYEIESGSPRLVIKQVSIKRGGRAIFRYQNEESSNQLLEVRLQVFGYMRAE